MAAPLSEHPVIDSEMENIDEDDDDFGITDEIGKEKELTPDGGVVKKILQAGEGWETPATGDEVFVHYVGTLTDGTKFDSSRDRDEPFTFALGKGQVIKGWDEGVKTMKKGEKAILTCKPEYAYGASGSPPTIPPNATLNFEVELLRWKSIKDISPDASGGVIKTITQEGSDWDTPKEADEALIRYTARVQGSDDAFATSGDDGVQFIVREGHLCDAVKVAVLTMKKGEKVHLVVKPEYGFGNTGTDEVPANATLEIDLELVSWNKVTEVVPGQVTMKTFKKSSEWKTPNEGAKVKIRYTATLLDGTEIERRQEGNEFEFITDEKQCPVKGLELAVMKMKQGEDAVITVAPQYAFGAAGGQLGGKHVAGGATLVFHVTLVECENAKESWEMSTAEKVAAASAAKDKGNVAFKEGDWETAAKRYQKAVSLVDNDAEFSDDEKKQARAVVKSCKLNIAATRLKQNDYSAALTACNDVLKKDPVNVKALYRRAQAYMGRADYVEAEADVKNALLLDADNKDVQLLQRKLKREMKLQNQRDAKLYSNMFAKLGQLHDDSENQSQKTNADVPMQDAETGPSGADADADKAAAAEPMQTEIAAN